VQIHHWSTAILQVTVAATAKETGVDMAANVAVAILAAKAAA